MVDFSKFVPGSEWETGVFVNGAFQHDTELLFCVGRDHKGRFIFTPMKEVYMPMVFDPEADRLKLCEFRPANWNAKRSGEPRELPLQMGEFVRTRKGARFCGKIIAFDNDTKNPGCTVLAVHPDFAGTKHVYPLAQLEKAPQGIPGWNSTPSESSRDTSAEEVQALFKRVDKRFINDIGKKAESPADRVPPNTPYRAMTDTVLRAEYEHWLQKCESAPGFSSAYFSAQQLAEICAVAQERGFQWENKYKIKRGD